jgi:metal-sulfur cluster biosynthetic enzyme
MSASNKSVILQRDCDAILVPAGTPVNLPAGTQVVVTQELGGNVTVNIYGNLARIATKDLDALGLDPSELPALPTIDYNLPLIDQAYTLLKTCYDPEIPVNILELGLIYDLQLQPPSEEQLSSTEPDFSAHPIDRQEQKIAQITMTLTAPGCGFGPVLIEEIKSKLNSLPGILDTHIELVFDPPWSQDRISDEAKLSLNLF